MVSLNFEQHEVFRRWISLKLRIPDLLPGSTTISVIRDGRIIAVAAYSNWVGNDCWISLAGERGWLTKGIIPVFFKYPFNQLGCRRISAFCRKSNSRIITFCEKFGFKTEGILRKYHEDGDDCVILGLLKEDCKWV